MSFRVAQATPVVHCCVHRWLWCPAQVCSPAWPAAVPRSHSQFENSVFLLFKLSFLTLSLSPSRDLPVVHPCACSYPLLLLLFSFCCLLVFLIARLLARNMTAVRRQGVMDMSWRRQPGGDKLEAEEQNWARNLERVWRGVSEKLFHVT
jgi:hypothetical protein